jgi:adenylate kinase
MKLVIVGAPGSGKGTQGPLIAERYGLCHLATGDMLRAAVAAGTPNGLRAKAVMDAGGLVDDDIVFPLLKDGIDRPECANGYIIDGIPRTLSNAEKLEGMGETVDRAIFVHVPDDTLLDRTSGRWLHRASGRTYHEKFCPPKRAGVDDVTGEPLMQRKDDKREVVAKRLGVFHEAAGAMRQFYQRRGVVLDVDGDQPVNRVAHDLFWQLDALQATQKKSVGH